MGPGSRGDRGVTWGHHRHLIDWESYAAMHNTSMDEHVLACVPILDASRAPGMDWRDRDMYTLECAPLVPITGLDKKNRKNFLIVHKPRTWFSVKNTFLHTNVSENI